MTVIEYLRRNPARVLGLIGTVIALLAVYGVSLPGPQILDLASAALLLLGGEAAQRVENRKTDRAAWPTRYEHE